MTYDDAKAFIGAWYAEATLAGVCRRLGMDARTVSNRAASLRRAGLRLLPRAANRSVDKSRLSATEVARLKRLEAIVIRHVEPLDLCGGG